MGEEEYGQEDDEEGMHHHHQQYVDEGYAQHHHHHQFMGGDENGNSPGGDEDGEGYISHSQISEREHIEEDPIQEKIAKIIQICKENDALFGDSEFPAADQSLYKDITNPPEYS